MISLKKAITITAIVGATLSVASPSEAATLVYNNNGKAMIMDEVSVSWSGDEKFNTLLYKMNGDTVTEKTVYTFEYRKKYRGWYYYPIGDDSVDTRANKTMMKIVDTALKIKSAERVELE